MFNSNIDMIVIAMTTTMTLIAILISIPIVIDTGTMLEIAMVILKAIVTEILIVRVMAMYFHSNKTIKI